MYIIYYILVYNLYINNLIVEYNSYIDGGSMEITMVMRK